MVLEVLWFVHILWDISLYAQMGAQIMAQIVSIYLSTVYNQIGKLGESLLPLAPLSSVVFVDATHWKLNF